MATRKLSSVRGLRVKVPSCNIEEALAKFNGKHTSKTQRAAWRIASKLRPATIPKSCFQLMWNLVGRFQMEVIEISNEEPSSSVLTVRFGEMIAAMPDYEPNRVWFWFRGAWVAKTSGGGYGCESKCPHCWQGFSFWDDPWSAQNYFLENNIRK